ncbi:MULTISPECIES: polysaccharide biosynthesis protein [Micromonospora]|uniref:UDP-glucose 4-epimerase n=1 Tax=Micromonospora sicca TaxID=2202420 RepID=A0A317DB95_9ACTN|nr:MULTISPECIES: polysaccharide biosynthesis protein [unclassified Micromonospora]MBM0225053.1 polysaccharide biosynthesis protein [Micromonospora sp. ATA51]PWR12029.1 UDP-glucose 4-epimerase [Micromonospora sp. 4G51]
MTLLETDARVLITGGTGSFGHTMVRRLLDRGVGEVRVLSRDEAKQDAMRHTINDERVRYQVGDIRDFETVLRATRNVDHIFHAAALKQVPACEFFPVEAIRTNVLGSANVVEAAERNAVRSVVLLSTDKAVQPVNAMGMTKAVMEKLAQAHARTHDSATTVSCVRYGNVMYSRGSVIPLFVEQIKAGRAPTVTDPDMTRFLMSLADSVRLVEHAFRHARAGDVFIHKASACTVGDLAMAVCQLFDVPEKLDVVGTRLGEKLHECLASAEEVARADDFGDFIRVPVDARGLQYSPYGAETAGTAGTSDLTSAHAPRLDVPRIRDLLLGLPEIRAELALREPVLVP